MLCRLLVFVCSLTFLNVQVAALPPVYHLAATETLTLAQAAERLRKQVGGRVLGAKTIETDAGQRVYQIKMLLKPGKVKIYWVAPQGGKIL